MNLVMHQFLSFDHAQWQVGNHMGEVVKGKQYLNYEAEIQTGILLHRFIDSYSDAHPLVKNSSKRLHGNYGKFAPIIVDVYYDFLLIKNWETFNIQSFTGFKNACYVLLSSQMNSYPDKLKKFTQAMVKYDWFGAYSTYDGLELILKNMSKRTKFQNNMHMAVKDLYMHESGFEQDFLAFFPDLLDSTCNFLGIETPGNIRIKN